jgi:YkoP domain
MLRNIIRNFDAFICRLNGVHTFSDDIDCIIRIQLTEAPHAVSFQELKVAQGDPILMYHLWNERLPRLPPEGASLAWSARLLQLFKKSLHLVAQYIQETPNLPDIHALAGVTVLLPTDRGEGTTNLMERLGFTTIPYQSPLGRFGEFWENFYTWGLMWTYSPVSLRGHSLLKLKRKECWMNIQNFLKRYGKH